MDLPRRLLLTLSFNKKQIMVCLVWHPDPQHLSHEIIVSYLHMTNYLYKLALYKKTHKTVMTKELRNEQLLIRVQNNKWFFFCSNSLKPIVLFTWK